MHPAGVCRARRIQKRIRVDADQICLVWFFPKTRRLEHQLVKKIHIYIIYVRHIMFFQPHLFLFNESVETRGSWQKKKKSVFVLKRADVLNKIIKEDYLFFTFLKFYELILIMHSDWLSSPRLAALLASVCRCSSVAARQMIKLVTIAMLLRWTFWTSSISAI